jgi:hypothetical protein
MVDSGSDSDTQDLTQEWCEQQEFVLEDKMDVPEELLKGIEEGYLESKMAMATTMDVEKWGGGKQRPPAKKTVMEMQVGKAVLFTADTKVRDGRLKGAVKRTKRYQATTDLTREGELTSKCSKKAVESPDSRGMKAMQLASPEKLEKGRATKAGEGSGKRMILESEAGNEVGRKPKLVRKSLVPKAARVKVSQAEILQVVQGREARMRGQVRAAVMEHGAGRYPSITDLTREWESTFKRSKKDALESPDSGGTKAMQLASPEKLQKERATKAGEGSGKRMKIVSSTSSPSPLKRKLQEGVQGIHMGNIGFSGMGFEEEQKRMRQTEAQMALAEKKRMFELGKQAGISKWAGSAGNLAMKGSTMKGNVADKGSLLMKSPVKAPLAMGKQGNQGKAEIGKVQQGQRQYLHSTNASPMVKAMSELAKVKKRLMSVESKMETRVVEMNAMKRRMQRLEVMVDSLQAKLQENAQGEAGGRSRGVQGRNLDAW